MRNKATALCAFLTSAAFLAPVAAHANAVISFVQSGTGVVGTLSGSLSFTSPGCCTTLVGLGVQPNAAIASFGAVGDTQTGTITGISGPASFGPGGGTTASSSTGAAVYFLGAAGELWLPSTYISGDSLMATSTFDGASFSSLGMTPGQYVYTLPSGSTLTVVVSTPEPSSLSLLAVGLLGFGLIARRRRQGGAPGRS